MNRWWRAYDEAVDDPKLIGLTDEQFRFWFNILCVCSAFGGSLPDVRTVSIKLRMQPRRIVRLLNDLQSAELLDDANGLISPHNWQLRQYRSDVSTERVKRFRQRFSNVSRNVSETPPEYRVQSTEKKDIDPAPNGAECWPSDFRERFWEAYPRKVAKKAAIRKLEAVHKSGECAFARLMQAIGSIDASEPKYIPHPATWLNQGRWEDQPAANGGMNGTHRQNSLAAVADDLIERARELERARGIDGETQAVRSAGSGKTIDGTMA